METKKLLMNWRGTPIGARTPGGSPSIGLTRRVGRALRCGLTAVLMLFAAQGAWADDYTGYVYTANQTYDSFKNNHPDEPWIWLEKTTYNMQNDVNVYEFRLKYSAQGTSVQNYFDGIHNKYYYTGAAAFGWFGDVWLTIDGARIFNLSKLVMGVNGYTGYIGSPAFLYDPFYTYNPTVTYGFNGDVTSTKYSKEEFLSDKTSGIGNTTDVYVSLCKAKTGEYNNWTCGSWYPNMSNFHVNHDNYVTVRVAIERAWSHKNYTIGIEGTWGGDQAQYYDRSSTPMYTRTYKITTSTDAFTAPSVPWPSNGGTLTHNGSKKVTYKAPSGLSSKTGKQNKTSDWTVDQTESCTFLNNVYLMKNAGNESLPWTSINNTSMYYDKLENVSSSQTVDITEGVSNYDPFYVYPCWELKSENVYIALPSLPSSKQYNQNHNKFMDALVVPGYPCPTNVDVKTVDAFSRQVNVSWGWQVYDANHCDKNGKWYVYRLDSNGQRIKLGDVSNGSNPTYNLNYTASSENDKPAYDTDYTYIVCFVPNGWNNVTSENDVPGLSASKIAKVEPKFANPTTTATATSTKVTVSWKHGTLNDASASNKYSLEVQRSEDSGDNKTWTTVQTFEISDPGKTTGSWEDTNISSNTTYYYRVRFPSVQGKAWEGTSCSVNCGGSSFVENSFRASRGEYSSAVKLQWQVDQVGTGECYFTLQRRPLGTEGDGGWATIYTTHGTASTYSYEDQTAPVGSFNEYKLILSEKVNGVMKTGSSTTTDGFCMATGTMSGRVAFGSGTAVDGVKVTMRPSSTSGTSVNRFRSLYFANSGAGMNCVVDSVYLRKMMQGDFTFQMWVNPDNSKMNVNRGSYLLVDVKNAFSIYLYYDSSLKIYHVGTT